MESAVGYGVSALHRRFVDIQGSRPAFVGAVNLQQKYCIYSFEPIGLVRRATNDTGFIRHVKDNQTDHTNVAPHLILSAGRAR
jgi:hypothetical protein